MNIDKTDPDVARESKKNPKRNVAVVGIFNKNNKILLVLTKRFPNHWQPIGGGMKDNDSSPRETLSRELYEETNLKIRPDDFKFELETDYDFGDGKVYFFSLALPQNTDFVFDNSELIDWKWADLKESKNLNMFPATKKFINHLINNNTF